MRHILTNDDAPRPCRATVTRCWRAGGGFVSIAVVLLLIAAPAVGTELTSQQACDRVLSFLHGPNERPSAPLSAEIAARAKPECKTRFQRDPDDPTLLGATALIQLQLDDETALDDLKTAAKKGNVGAANMLFSLAGNGALTDGRKSSIIDRERASMEWARIGAEAGDSTLQAHLASILWFLFPNDAEKISEGERWARASANQGDEYGRYVLAGYLIGDTPTFGDGVRTDAQTQEGQLILEALRKAKSPLARFQYAKDRLFRSPSKMEVSLAITELERLGKLGVELAYYTLGLIFFKGYPVDQDVNRGLAYICQAGPEVQAIFKSTEDYPFECQSAN